MNGTRARLLSLTGGMIAVLLGLLAGWALRQREPAPKPSTAAANSETRPSSPRLVSQLGRPPAALAEEEVLIRAVLTDQSIDHAEAAHRLFALVADASRPLKSRQQALTHALNLVDDADHQAEVKPILLSPSLPGPLAEAIWTNLHERPDDIQLELAKALASEDGNPLQEDAAQLLLTFPGLEPE